jgi:hypothetical protein
MDGAAGDGGLPREYHRVRQDHFQLSVRLGGLSCLSSYGLSLVQTVCVHSGDEFC